MTDVATPTAGWYADPSDGTRMRWWDGSGWTEHTEPLPATDTAPPAREPGFDGASLTDMFMVPEPVATEISPSLAAAWAVADEDPEAFRRRTIGGPGAAQAALRGARTGSPHTLGVWLLALSPATLVGVAMLASTLCTMLWQAGAITEDLDAVSHAAAAIAWGFMLLVGVTAIFSDHARLAARGYAAPTQWLAIALLVPVLGPLVYLIVRTVLVRRNGRTIKSPLVVYCVQAGAVVGLIVLSLVLSVALLAMTGGTTTRPSAIRSTATPLPTVTLPPHGALSNTAPIEEYTLKSFDTRMTKDDVARELAAADSKASAHEWQMSCPDGARPFPIGQTECLAYQVPKVAEPMLYVQHLVFTVYPDGHVTMSGTVEVYDR